jgi:hypothetical protein
MPMPQSTENQSRPASRLQAIKPALICFGIGSALVLAGSFLRFWDLDPHYITLLAGFGLQVVAFGLFIANAGRIKS